MTEVLVPPEGDVAPDQNPAQAETVAGAEANIGLSLITKEGGEAYISSLREELEDPQMLSISKMLGSADRIHKETAQPLLDGGQYDQGRRVDVISDGIKSNARRIYGDAAVKRLGQIQEALGVYERRPDLYLYDEQAHEVMAGLLKDATNHDDELIRFIDDKILPEAAEQHQEGNSLTLLFHETDGAVEIPLSMIVSAIGFESWETGRGNDEKGSLSSIEVMDDYAGRETPIPLIDDLHGFMLPDGSMYFLTGNSHRVGAAKNKGDTTIRFAGKATIVQLDTFIPELESAEMPVAA